MRPDPVPVPGGIKMQAYAAAEHIDRTAETQQRFEAETKPADLFGPLAGRVRIQECLNTSLVDGMAGIGTPQAEGVDFDNDLPAAFRGGSLGDRVSRVLNEFGDLPVCIAARQYGRLDVGMFFGIVGRCAVGGEALRAELFRIADQLRKRPGHHCNRPCRHAFCLMFED